MTLWAHSQGRGRPAQVYKEHVQQTQLGVRENIQCWRPFISKEKFNDYLNIGESASAYHDVGKLDPANQEILNGNRKARKLPIDHRDAGVEFLLKRNQVESALLVYAHHKPGLPNMRVYGSLKAQKCMRSKIPDVQLEKLISLHEKTVDQNLNGYQQNSCLPHAISTRMLLSCLVDADYGSTAGNQSSGPSTRWNERIQSLYKYINLLEKRQVQSQRNQVRKRLFMYCEKASLDYPMEYCDSPVGTGKTTAVMIHMLKKADQYHFRHIFVVLPYTNIISQTVRILREALVLPGENPEAVVAENHHQADFEKNEYRQLSVEWKAPIIVTTAVQFFETLASSIPHKLRKLHELPGSGVIFDEFHASLPISLINISWYWISQLQVEWGCQFCFCSGTAFRFWENPLFHKISCIPVHPLLPNDFVHVLDLEEKNRFSLKLEEKDFPHFQHAEELIQCVVGAPGPRLIVTETVRSAAFLAKIMREKGYNVLHLSTALTPADRGKIIEEVQKRLNLNYHYTQDWTLVATSCIECGVDFSFRSGFCEKRSLSSYLQISGRVNRNGEYADTSLVCFTISDPGFTQNRIFNTSREVFDQFIKLGELGSQTITESVTKEFNELCKKIDLPFALLHKECAEAFEDVNRGFHIIDDSKVTVLVDVNLSNRLERGENVNWRELQKNSVRMYMNVLNRLSGKALEERELYVLPAGNYDSFLGYMKKII